jgi:hypothetical protein
LNHRENTTSNRKIGWSRLLLLGLGTRLVVLLMGIASPQRWANANVTKNPHLYAQLTSGWRHWIEPWYRWDACHYITIALSGYSYKGNPSVYSNVAFMPLLPMLIAAGARLGLDPYALGLVIPNVAFIFAIAVFGKIALRLTDDARLAWRACVLLCAFPTAFFFSAPYEESLGFLFVSLSILAWMSERGRSSAATMAVAALARQATLASALAFPLQWFDDLRKGRPRRDSAWLVLLGALAGCAAVALFMYWKFDDPFVSSKVQAAWGRSQPSPLNLLRALWPRSFHLSDLTDYVTMFLVLGLSVRAFRKRGIFWAEISALPILLAMSTGTALSMKRYALTSFPAFIEAAEVTTERRLFWPAVVLCAVLQASLIYSFVNWGFTAP